MLDLERPPTRPGEMLLEEFLRPANLTQVEAARRMNIPLNRLNEVVRGRRGITADTALRLARLFDMSPEFWMARGRRVAPGGVGVRAVPGLGRLPQHGPDAYPSTARTAPARMSTARST